MKDMPTYRAVYRAVCFSVQLRTKKLVLVAIKNFNQKLIELIEILNLN